MSTLDRCHCGAPLSFSGVEHVTCWCERCKLRSLAGDDDAGHVVFAYGHGETKNAAALNLRNTVDSF